MAVAVLASMIAGVDVTCVSAFPLLPHQGHFCRSLLGVLQ